jgi:hypothetical protein
VNGAGDGGFTSSGGNSISNEGNPIAAGDLLIVGVNLVETGRAVDRQIRTPPEWTAIPGLPLSYDGEGGFPFNISLFWKVATSADATAPGAWWRAPDIVWAGRPTRSGFGCLFNYRGADATTPIEDSAKREAPASLRLIAPSVTARSPAATLLTLYALYDAVHPLGTAPPSTGRLKFKASTGYNAYIMASDEPLEEVGPTGGRSASATAAAAPYVSLSLVIGGGRNLPSADAA